MNTTLQNKDKTYIAGTYARFPVDVCRGKGSLLYDSEGKEYIDLGSGIGVTAFGSADEEWKNAVTAQLGLVQHTSNLYYTGPCADLAELLCQRTGMKKVFFCNSGAEANEGLIKAARKYASSVKGPEYSVIVTLKNSFHGRTLTTLAATGQDHYHELYQPLTPGFLSVPAEDTAALAKVLEEEKVAAVLIECIQGEGGVIPLSPSYVKKVRRLTAEKDVLLGIDEVQTGNGRTGELYAYMNYGIEPDLFSTAKGLGGGLPIGAVLLGEKLSDVFGPGDHGSTFGGNPVCCAGALNILSRIDDSLLAEVKEKSRLIFSTLTGAPGVESVSGMGLMVGIKTVKPAAQVVASCIARGVLCLTAKDKVRLLPALNIPTDLLKKALSILCEVCAES